MLAANQKGESPEELRGISEKSRQTDRIELRPKDYGPDS